MRLDPKSPRQISHPDDLLMLVRSSKDGIVFGLESWKRPEGDLDRPRYDRYGEPISGCSFTDDLEYLCVVAATESYVHFRKWIYNPQTCRDEDYRTSMGQFRRPGFREPEKGYTLTLDWYAPKGWRSALSMLAACAED